MDGAAAERGEARAEDRSRVDEIAVGDDALGKRRTGLGHVGFDETIGKIMLFGSILLALFGFYWMKKTIEIDI